MMSRLFIAACLMSFSIAGHACETSLNPFLSKQIEKDETLNFLRKEIHKASAQLHQIENGVQECQKHQHWQDRLDNKYDSAKSEHYYYPKTCRLKVELAIPLVKHLNELNKILLKKGVILADNGVDTNKLFIEKRAGHQYFLVKDLFEHKQTNFVGEHHHYTLHEFHYDRLKNQDFSCPSQQRAYFQFTLVPGANERIVNYLVLSAYTNAERQMFKDDTYAKSKLQSKQDESLFLMPHLDYLGNTVLSFHLTRSVFTGGAHANHTSEFYSFDLIEQKKIKLHQVFQANKKQEVTKIAQKYFDEKIAHLGLKNEDLFLPKDDKESLQKHPYYDLQTGFYIPEAFYIGENGITFVYQVYEISSYATGQISFTVPWSSIEQTLTPYMSKLIGTFELKPIGLPQLPG